MNVGLDAPAMIAFLRGEPGAEAVVNNVQNPECNASAHSLNCCEVYYNFARARGEALRDPERQKINLRLADELELADSYRMQRLQVIRRDLSPSCLLVPEGSSLCVTRRIDQRILAPNSQRTASAPRDHTRFRRSGTSGKAQQIIKSAWIFERIGR